MTVKAVADVFLETLRPNTHRLTPQAGVIKLYKDVGRSPPDLHCEALFHTGWPSKALCNLKSATHSPWLLQASDTRYPYVIFRFEAHINTGNKPGVLAATSAHAKNILLRKKSMEVQPPRAVDPPTDVKVYDDHSLLRYDKRMDS